MNPNLFYFVWIPVVFFYYMLYSFISKKLNDSQQTTWFISLYLMQVFGMWPIVSKYSKNLLVDGILYDILIIVSFYGTLIIMGSAKEFSFYQTIGLIISLLGIIIIKLN